MAEYLPIRGLSRSQSVRIGSQQITPNATYYVDISDGPTKRDLAHHSTLGSYIVVGPVSQDTGDVVVNWGVQTTQGANGTDLVITTEAGELRNRDTGDYVDVDSTDITLSAADATNPRIDIVQVNTTTGAVAKKNGTAAATPAAPAPDASNIVVAEVLLPANDTAVTTSQITDRRPRG
jgi:hypothetical protein